MTTATIIKKQETAIRNLSTEIRDIKIQLRKFLAIIPEERLSGYRNASQIKKAYLKAQKSSR